MDITMNQTLFNDGDTVIATSFKLLNLRAAAEAVELAVWLEIPAYRRSRY